MHPVRKHLGMSLFGRAAHGEAANNRIENLTATHAKSCTGVRTWRPNPASCKSKSDQRRNSREADKPWGANQQILRTLPVPIDPTRQSSELRYATLHHGTHGVSDLWRCLVVAFQRGVGRHMSAASREQRFSPSLTNERHTGPWCGCSDEHRLGVTQATHTCACNTFGLLGGVALTVSGTRGGLLARVPAVLVSIGLGLSSKAGERQAKHDHGVCGHDVTGANDEPLRNKRCLDRGEEGKPSRTSPIPMPTEAHRG